MENSKRPESLLPPSPKRTGLWIFVVLLGVGLLALIAFEGRSLFEKPPSKPLPSQMELDLLAQNPKVLLRGQALFQVRCAVCHGPKGEGKIGPNLTDNYWLHGDGSSLSILKISREGILDKAMPAWEHVVEADDLNAGAVYVRSLRGTNPPDAKAPQGEVPTTIPTEDPATALKGAPKTAPKKSSGL